VPSVGDRIGPGQKSIHCLGGIRKRGRGERGDGGKGVRAKEGKRKESGGERRKRMKTSAKGKCRNHQEENHKKCNC
jgi:hypothetical protein